MAEDKNELGEEEKESDEHKKRGIGSMLDLDEEGSKKSSLKNPIYWIAALGFVLWWKWDEVQTWFN